MTDIKVFVLEDSKDDASHIQDMLENIGYNVTVVNDNTPETRRIYTENTPDIVILDIYVNGKKKGVEFAKYINDSETLNRPIIFLTSAIDKATFVSAKGEQPHSYLLKPANPLELQYAIELAIENYVQKKGKLSSKDDSSILLKDRFYIKKGNKLYKVLIDDIDYISVEGKYSIIHVEDREFLIQTALIELEEKLKFHHFFKTHRSRLVNLRKIQSIHPTEYFITLENKKELPVSQRYRKDLLAVLEVLR